MTDCICIPVTPGYVLTNAEQYDRPDLVWTLRRVTLNSNTRITGWAHRPSDTEVVVAWFDEIRRVAWPVGEA